MRVRTAVLVGCLLAVGMVLLFWAGATPANAGGDTKVAVSPRTAAPGDRVNVLATCQTGQASSEVFPTTALEPVVGNDTYRSGTTVTINHRAAAGTYTVLATCGEGGSATTQLVISSGGVHTGGGAAAGGADWVLLGAGLGVLGVAGALAVSRRGRRVVSTGS